MKKKYYWIVGIIILVFLLVLITYILYSESLTPTSIPPSPNKYYQILQSRQIQQKLNSLDRSCDVESDCEIASFDCPFPCGLCVNANADLTEINNDIKNYKRDFQEWCEIKCLIPICKCINNKCVNMPIRYNNSEYCDEYVDCGFYEIGPLESQCGNMYYVNATKLALVFDIACICNITENKCVIQSANK